MNSKPVILAAGFAFLFGLTALARAQAGPNDESSVTQEAAKSFAYTPNGPATASAQSGALPLGPPVAPANVIGLRPDIPVPATSPVVAPAAESDSQGRPLSFATVAAPGPASAPVLAAGSPAGSPNTADAEALKMAAYRVQDQPDRTFEDLNLAIATHSYLHNPSFASLDLNSHVRFEFLRPPEGSADSPSARLPILNFAW